MDSYWVVVAVVYFLLSFITGWWHLSWLIFVVAVPMQSYLNYLMKESAQDF